MKNFKLVCPADGYTKVVPALSVEEAVTMLLVDEEVKAHLVTHPEMAGVLPEDMKQKLAGLVTEEVVAPEGGDMSGGMPTGGVV